LGSNAVFRVLAPTDFLRVPWKNGGGVSTTIASEGLPGASPGDWAGTIWQLGRTRIVAPAPFSDLTGFDRVQIVIRGSGLVLETPAGEIDLRAPLRPARYDGGLAIVSRLENGPVEVVNLIARRDLRLVDMTILEPGTESDLADARHVVYTPFDAVQLRLGDAELDLPADHAIQLDGAAHLRAISGIAILASIGPR
jgi:uncharacterized protein